MRKECCKTLLVNEVSSWFQQTNTSDSPHPLKAHMRHGGRAQEDRGLWDWLPAARSWTVVLQLCCSTQLETPYAAPLSCWVATPPTHTGGSTLCVCVCVFAFVAVVYTNNTNTLVRSKKQGFSCSFMFLDARIDDAQRYNHLTDCIRFWVMGHCCNTFLIPAHLFTPKQSNFGCHCSFD